MNQHLLQHFQISPTQEFFLELAIAGYPSIFEKTRACVKWGGITTHIDGSDYQHLFRVGGLGWCGAHIGIAQIMKIGMEVENLLDANAISRMLRYQSLLHDEEAGEVELDWTLLKIVGLTMDLTPEPFKFVPISSA